MLAGVLRRMRCVSLLEVNGGGFLKACRSTSGSTYRNYFIKLNQNTIHHPIPGYQCVGCVCVFIEGCVGEALCFGRSRWSICLSFCHSDVFLYTIPCFIFVATLYIKIKDIRPSMVTHTLNSCSSINPSKVHTHSSEHTHTHTHTLWTHNRSSGQPFILRCPGSSWGFGALLKGTSVMVLRAERALYIHCPHQQYLPARDSNSQPFTYESDSLTIRPRLPRLPQ